MTLLLAGQVSDPSGAAGNCNFLGSWFSLQSPASGWRAVVEPGEGERGFGNPGLWVSLAERKV